MTTSLFLDHSKTVSSIKLAKMGCATSVQSISPERAKYMIGAPSPTATKPEIIPADTGRRKSSPRDDVRPGKCAALAFIEAPMAILSKMLAGMVDATSNVVLVDAPSLTGQLGNKWCRMGIVFHEPNPAQITSPKTQIMVIDAMCNSVIGGLIEKKAGGYKVIVDYDQIDIPCYADSPASPRTIDSMKAIYSKNTTHNAFRTYGPTAKKLVDMLGTMSVPEKVVTKAAQLLKASSA